MSSITIRDVPEETHAELAARAGTCGQSLQEYLRAQLVEMARRPDAKTLVARLRTRKQTAGTFLPGERILEYRNRGRR